MGSLPLPPCRTPGRYVETNKGIDSEKDYPYQASTNPCWANASTRVVATISGSKDVPADNEAQLAAAVLINPVSVAIEADQSMFQSYKYGGAARAWS